ncbi:hypothetical protein GBAR_LOCUS1158 [Geodia barretti]|uniref:Uncharacterized protein n=1 Tax=Geodia barretti TaxID=519541 RepID=A0AA35QVQ3_GEOBA|nr:hypothetical protein GBAR_LOCUS1158 [Geodia barretti]
MPSGRRFFQCHKHFSSPSNTSVILFGYSSCRRELYHRFLYHSTSPPRCSARSVP